MAATEWFQEAIIYHILIDRFAGVRFGQQLRPYFLGGNLRALAEKLPYLENLGINTLWLSPLLQDQCIPRLSRNGFFQC
jgi:glycosidase